MTDEIEITTEQTVNEIAEAGGVDAESLIEYIAEGIEEAHNESGVDALEQMLGPEELA
jgi:hypothetical protein